MICKEPLSWVRRLDMQLRCERDSANRFPLVHQVIRSGIFPLPPPTEVLQSHTAPRTGESRGTHTHTHTHYPLRSFSHYPLLVFHTTRCWVSATRCWVSATTLSEQPLVIQLSTSHNALMHLVPLHSPRHLAQLQTTLNQSFAYTYRISVTAAPYLGIDLGLPPPGPAGCSRPGSLTLPTPSLGHPSLPFPRLFRLRTSYRPPPQPPSRPPCYQRTRYNTSSPTSGPPLPFPLA